MATASAAEIKVISANGMRNVIAESMAKFEAISGHRLKVSVMETGEIRRRVLAGQAFDVIILGQDVAAELERQGKIVPGTAVELTRIGFGLAVSAAASRPDVSTPEAFKRTLLAANTVIITDPANGGISGVHFMEVLNKLGIADQMKDKLVLAPGGELHAKRVALGEADLAVQAEHEIRSAGGAIFLDYPAIFQRATLFVGGVSTATSDIAAAQSYLAFLTGPEAATAYSAHCLEQRAGSVSSRDRKGNDL
jgi:molybdate transport system substrate-binding protein